MRVHQDPARFRVLAAGRRFGKTTLALDELIERAAKSAKPCWYVAPTYRQAKMIAWEMLLAKLPKELIESKNEVELTVKMIVGAPICLKGADNEDSLRGVGLSFAVLDEYATMKPNVWPEIIRPMLSDEKAGALFISTPKGKDAFWELWMKGQRKEGGFSSYRFGTVDNPFIDPSEVEDAKKQINERYFRQEYEASFEDFTGLIWPEFRQDLHVIDPIYLPISLNRIAAIDPATTGTTACLKAAINEDGDLYIYSEYYRKDVRASEAAAELKFDELQYRWLIDPASSGSHIERNGKLFTLSDEYQDNGIVSEPAEKDVDMGINRVAEFFKANKIKIFSTCKNLIWELERYHWSEEKETSSGMIRPKPYKKDDHLCDTLRYLVSSRFSPSEPRQRPPNPDSPAGIVNRIKERQARRH